MADEPKKSNITGNIIDLALVGGAIGAGVLAYNYLKKQTPGTTPIPGEGKLGVGNLTLTVTT